MYNPIRKIKEKRERRREEEQLKVEIAIVMMLVNARYTLEILECLGFRFEIKE